MATDLHEIQEIGIDTQDAITSAKTDFNFLAMLALAGEFVFMFPRWYLVLFSLLTGFTKKIEKFAIGIPRGFAKTTFLKIICLWYILFSHKSFILVVSSNEKKACNILSDISDMLSSPNIRRLFGHWDANIEEDNSTTKVFFFRGREIILWAAGAGTSVRGINRKNKRPDVMVLDDIQDKEDAKNKELAKDLLAWMLSTLMMARSPFGCTYIFVGNMYPQNSILEKLKHDKGWTTLIAGGITTEAESLWEELKPIDELIEEYQSVTALGHPEVFLSEVMNSTDIALPSGIDISQIPHMPSYYLDQEGEGSFIVIDPSSGKKHGDDCSIEHFEVMDGKSILDEVEAGTFTSRETIKIALDMAIRRNTRLICVEDVAYQATLLENFQNYCDDNGITGFYFEPVSPKGRAKNNRIKAGAVRVLAGEILLHPKIRSLVISQYIEWNPLRTNNVDDIIDPIGYEEEIRQEYAELIVRNLFQAILETHSGEASHTGDLQLSF